MAVHRWTDEDGINYVEVNDDTVAANCHVTDNLTGQDRQGGIEGIQLPICHGQYFWATIAFTYSMTLDYYLSAFLVLRTPTGWQTAYGASHETPGNGSCVIVQPSNWWGALDASGLGDEGISTYVDLYVAWDLNYNNLRGPILSLSLGNRYQNVASAWSTRDNRGYQFSRKVG